MHLNKLISAQRLAASEQNSFPATVSPKADYVIKFLFAVLLYPLYLLFKVKESILNSFKNRRTTKVWDDEDQEFKNTQAASETIAYDTNLLHSIRIIFSSFMMIDDDNKERRFYHQYYNVTELIAYVSSLYRHVDYILLCVFYTGFLVRFMKFVLES